MSGISAGRARRGSRRRLDLGNSDAPRLAVSFTNDQVDWLKRQADKRGITVAAMVRLCIQANVSKEIARQTLAEAAE